MNQYLSSLCITIKYTHQYIHNCVRCVFVGLENSTILSECTQMCTNFTKILHYTIKACRYVAIHNIYCLPVSLGNIRQWSSVHPVFLQDHMDQCDTVPRHTMITSTCTYQHGKTCYYILYSQKFSRCVYFAFESLISIFMDIILFMACQFSAKNDAK